MASRRISIFDNFLSGGKVGSKCRSWAKAILNASTLIRSLVAWAILYLAVARRLLRRSSLLNLAISGSCWVRDFPEIVLFPDIFFTFRLQWLLYWSWFFLETEYWLECPYEVTIDWLHNRCNCCLLTSSWLTLSVLSMDPLEFSGQTKLNWLLK